VPARRRRQAFEGRIADVIGEELGVRRLEITDERGREAEGAREEAPSRAVGRECEAHAVVEALKELEEALEAAPLAREIAGEALVEDVGPARHRHRVPGELDAIDPVRRELTEA